MCYIQNNFTILRLILATLVVFGHFKFLPNNLPAHGLYNQSGLAVDAFFVISGYLVYASFDKLPSPKPFYIKRFFRIYPLYALMIFVQAIVMILLLGEKAQAIDILEYLGSNLIFANFLHPALNGVFLPPLYKAINLSLWTLKNEVVFYLFVPFLWKLVKKYGFSVLLIIYAISTIYYVITSDYGDDVSKQFPSQLRFFMVGIGMYLYCHPALVAGSGIVNFNSVFFPRPRYKNGVTAILIVTIFTICNFRHELHLLPIYPLLVAGLVFICAFRLPVIPLKYDISYGVYLIHAPLIQLSLLFGIFEDNLWFLFLLLVTIYILAFLAEKFVELPMVRAGKKYAK